MAEIAGDPVPTPLVSLGLPVFNGEEFLSRALDGVLAQTFSNFELIISDNASTDATPDIIRAYAARDSRIRCFRQETNIGVGNNWTFVAKQARASLFKWASANDEYAPDLVERCVAVMLRRDPSVVLCYGRTQFIDEASRPLGIYSGDFDALAPDPLQRYALARRKVILGTPLQSGVVRRNALMQCGYLGNYWCSDQVLIASLALHGKIVLLPEVLFFRRWAKGVASPLKTPLEREQMYQPNAVRPSTFVRLRWHAGQLAAILRAPLGLKGRIHGVSAVLGFTVKRALAKLRAAPRRIFSG